MRIKLAKLSQVALVLFLAFVVITLDPVSAAYLVASSITTTTMETSNGEVLSSYYRLSVELRLEERSALCSLSMEQTPWSNQSQAIEAVQEEISNKLVPYDLSFEIEYVKFSENAPMGVDFIVTGLTADGGPLKYGYNNYSFELGWLADWAGAPFTQWTEKTSSINQGVIDYLKEVEGKTYRFTLDPFIQIQGFTNITKRTETQVTYSIFVPNTILDLQILQNGIKVTNITNFLNRSEFNQIYSQGEQYRAKVLKEISEELAVKLSPYGLTATDFEVYLSEPYSAVGIHYTVQGAVEKTSNNEYKVNLKFLNISLSEFTVSQTSYSTILRYMGDLAGEKALVTISCKSFYSMENNILICLPSEVSTTTATTTASTTTTATTTATTTTTTKKSENLYTYLITVLADNSGILLFTSLTILAGVLIWRGHVRSVWSRGSFDYDTFRLLVRMKGGRTRVNLLRSLGEQKNKLQLAKELGMDWKAVDRHIKILLKYSLIRESESMGNVKYYSLTPDGRKVLELLEELNNVNQESGGKGL